VSGHGRHGRRPRTLAFDGASGSARSELISCLLDPLLGLIEVVLHLAEHSLADPALVGNQGEALFQLIKLCFSQIFEGQKLIAGTFANLKNSRGRVKGLMGAT